MIIFLAYMHRYGWIAAMTGCIAIWPEAYFHIVCASFLLFSAWTLIGYHCKWRHIYCSYQNANHQKMTPHAVRWSQIKKSDAYGVPLIFFALGLAMLLYIIFN